MFKILFQIFQAFISQTRESLILLKSLPTTLQGFNYALKQNHNVSKQEVKLSLTENLHPNLLRNYSVSHKEGRGIWKWDHYFDIYHRHLNKFVGRDVCILEIGIYSGGSLEMWRHYFGSNCHVYGVDIEPACKGYENEYTEVFIGDQANRDFWKTFKEKVPQVDIIIDDGGHTTEQQIVTLEEMLSHLTPGGVYLCEDIHAYGFQNPFSAYLQGLINSLNSLSFADKTSEISVNSTPFQTWTHSIHLYPYVAVIEKNDSPVEQFICPKHGTEWQPFKL